MANLFQQGQSVAEQQRPAQGQQTQPQNPNPMQLLQSLRQNPVQVMKQAGYDIPENLAGNPLGIWNHLVSTGQVQQARAAQIQAMAQRMGRR